MTGLLIISPMPATFTAPGSGAANLGTPSPREIWVAPAAGAAAIDIDLGGLREVDSFFMAATNADAATIWTVQSITAIGGSVVETHVSGPLMLAGTIRLRPAAFARLPAPVTGRYFRIRVEHPSSPMEIGAIVLGHAFEWPYAYGSGRTPAPTSRIAPLTDGGFGVEEGTFKTIFHWRFVDLSNEALDRLWEIAEQHGEARPLVVVEGPDAPPRATSVHYGLFRRFEAYEREDAATTKWSMSLEEWR